MSSPIRVVVAVECFGSSEVQAIKELDRRLEVIQFRGVPGRKDLEGVEILFADTLSADAWLTPSLRWVQLFTAGVDVVPPPPQTSNVVASSTAGILAGPIAEHVFALLLALIRRLPEAIRAQGERHWLSWKRGEYAATELEGKTLGILGLGGVGSQVAARGQAFGMTVVGIRRSAGQVGEQFLVVKYGATLDLRVPVMVYPPGELNEVLARSDVIVVALPLTGETRHLIGPAEFGVVRPGSLLINVSRGEAIDTDALVRALADGRLAGAGLDVFDREPLATSSPLWAMQNVIITPHVAGVTDRIVSRVLEFFMGNLSRYLANQPLWNEVEPWSWYGRR